MASRFFALPDDIAPCRADALLGVVAGAMVLALVAVARRRAPARRPA